MDSDARAGTETYLSVVVRFVLLLTPLASNGRLQDPPENSLDFLHEEVVRQLEELSKAKDSVDNRATFVVGIPGIILSVFVGVFVDFWTSERPVDLAQSDPFLTGIALILTAGVMVTLLFAIMFGLVILLPKTFDIGIELVDAYEVAHNPEFDGLSLKEGSLRVLISSMSTSLPTYYRNVFWYHVATLLTLASLVYAAGFVGLLVSTPSNVAAGARLGVAWLVCTVAAFVTIGAVLSVRRHWRSAQATIMQEARRLARLETFIDGLNRSAEAAA